MTQPVGDEIAFMLKRAKGLNRAKEFQKAADVLKPYALDSDNEDLVNVFCSSHLSLGNFHICLHYLKKIQRKKKLSVLQQQMLAACFTANEDYPSAMAALETIPKDQKTAKIEQDYVTNMVRLGDPGGARERARRALKAFPEDPHLCFQDGLLSLELGLDSSGALNYKKRHVVFGSQTLPISLAPLWTGQPLEGKHILVWAEQGIGDELVFFSALRFLDDENITVSVVCSSRLKQLLIHNFPSIAEVFDRGKPSQINDSCAKFDFQTYVAELWPLMLKQAPSKSGSWLSLPPDDVAAFAKHPQFRPDSVNVGLAWFSKDERNCFPMQLLKNMLGDFDVRWFDIQYRPDEIRDSTFDFIDAAAVRIEEFSAHRDFCRFGAHLKNMSLLITNDTASAVFGSLLGVRTLVLTPCDAYWFWNAPKPLDMCRSALILSRGWDEEWQDFYTARARGLIYQTLSKIRQ